MIKLVHLLEIKNISNVTVDMVYQFEDNELMHTPVPVDEYWALNTKYNWEPAENDSEEAMKKSLQKIKDAGRLNDYYRDLVALYNKYKQD